MKSPDTYYGRKYGVSTVKQIKGLLSCIKEYGFRESDKIIKRYPKLKFVTHGVGGGAYVGNGFVVKDPYLCGNPPPRKLKCPTTTLRDGLLLQPRCKVFSDLPHKTQQKFIKAGLVIVDAHGHCSLVKGGDDAHEDNFGLLDGELKQFDW